MAERKPGNIDALPKTQRILENLARWMVIGGVILSPWLIGSAEPWAYLIIGSVIGLATMIWLVALLAASSIRLRAPRVLALLGVVLALVIVQTILLPERVVHLLNPLAADVVTQAHAVLAGIEADHPALLGTDISSVPYTLSLSPLATNRSLFLLVVYIAAFAVLANTTRTWDQLRRLTGAIIVSGFVMALLAIVHKFSGSPHILWFHTPRYGGEIFGPFTNRNHYAAYMNMVTGLGLGLFFSSRQLMEVMSWPDWRDRLSWLSSRNASRMALSAFAVVLFAGSVCVSLSRGGVLSLAVSVLILGFTVGWRRRDMRRLRSGVMAAAFLVGAAVLWLGGRDTVLRMQTLADIARNPLEDLRAIVTLDSLQIFRACPIFGIGFGAFRHVFSLFQSPDLELRWLQAHNDWVQLLVEGGILGAAAFMAAIVCWVQSVRRRFAAETDRAKLMSLGIFVGLVAIAIHSSIDYSLHKPANALMLSALAAFATAAGSLRKRGAAVAAEPGGAPRLGTPALRIIVVLALVSLGALLYSRRNILRGELAFTRFLYFEELAQNAPDAGATDRAVRNGLQEADLVMAFARDNPDALAETTGGLLRWSIHPGLARPLRLLAAKAGEASAVLAVRGAPSDYLTWLWLARSQIALSEWDDAERSLQRARELVRHDEQVRMYEPQLPPEAPDIGRQIP
jgi:O-antigen ligase